jgi:cytochrome c biogenesis protein CcmG/thiol:disulfide interchange protein DsbE
VRHPLRAVALALGVVIVGLGVTLALLARPSDQTGGRLLGQRAPAFSGPAIAGGTISSERLAGRTIVVNFWNDWCIPCRQETPALKAFYARHEKDPDFAMVGIVRDPHGERPLRAYARAEGLRWPLMLDPDGRAALDFATTGQPETFVIDATGVVVGFQAGPTTEAFLEAMLARARGLQ